MNPIPLSLYIHIPWCVRKCPYCDFNSHESQHIPEQEYITALLNDLKQDAPFAQQRQISTIFIGGGTPSLFSAQSYDILLNGIDAIVPIAKHAEITLEANPG
ncbi:MAG: YggW family oxidoreductase, partial [Pseudomonadales bacterium]|nr:YggW family oxidoreductase [Pseudomonadales bacterium]